MKNKQLKNKILKERAFKTPKGYFDLLEDDVIAKISSEKFDNKNAFSTPKNYFDSLEDKILEKINKPDLSADPGYKVPKDYFKTLGPAVEEKLRKQKKEVKVIKLKSLIFKRFVPVAVAASLILIVFLNNNNDTGTAMDKVAAQEVEQWIENDLLLFDSYEIAEVYSDIDLLDSPNNQMDDELLNFIDGTEIESLLIEN